ncbi:HAD-IIA family hydrolase [Arthrobacter sp. ok362]|uniref:HAD-IIA family hydrolase n=1 Tax=Arthrobacter sp. ok362 TaxID=1761745 RepID=UPI000885BF27|nr:HAD-IIA family hydrolase [Arthrobacter sp. ok362]SDL83667.1 NagD protein [Arthrobacter sp. ok362]
MPVELLAKEEAARTGTTPLYRGYAFDLDGTLYLGDDLIEGADTVVAALRGSGARVVFVTNKPLETAEAYAAKLTKLGIPAVPADVISALDALTLYLADRHPGARVLAVGEPVLIESLRGAGFILTENPAETDVVVVSFDRTFDYDKLTRAYQAVNAGAVIVATNPDPYCPTPDGGLPDCAAMLAAIEACTGGRAEAIVGKPSVHMANAFLDRLGVPASEAVMVGDRLLTDVAMGLNAGMASALVMSGATTNDHLAASTIHPTHVLDDVRGLIAA